MTITRRQFAPAAALATLAASPASAQQTSENVKWRCGIDVPEDKNVVGLVDDVRVDLFARDLAEETVGHYAIPFDEELTAG